MSQMSDNSRSGCERSRFIGQGARPLLTILPLLKRETTGARIVRFGVTKFSITSHTRTVQRPIPSSLSLLAVNRLDSLRSNQWMGSGAYCVDLAMIKQVGLSGRSTKRWEITATGRQVAEKQGD
jgi:hypothetical protein